MVFFHLLFLNKVHIVLISSNLFDTEGTELINCTSNQMY